MSLLSFFATAAEDGTYSLTGAGNTALVICMLLVLLLGSLIFGKDKKYDTRQLANSAICIALAFTTSFIKLFEMPMGGSVTLLSMFFIAFIGYLYGPYAGICSAVAYGFLQLIADPYIISFPQMITDYILAFGALGIAGFFHKKTSRASLIAAYVVGVLGRYLFATLSGVIFFGMWAPDNFPNPLVYSLAYNGSYLGAEAAITIAVLLVPAVYKAVLKVKNTNS